MELNCSQIVKELDKYIVGQSEAKKAVAIALRNRYRRSQLPKAVSQEITPRNIILKGPTGVGKTEIARRLAKLVKAPFIKVEATKYTEVGYVGRDVESMIRDLVEVSVRLVREEQAELVKQKATATVDKRLKDILYPLKKQNKPEEMETEAFRTQFNQDFASGKFDNDIIDIEVKERPQQIDIMAAGGGEINLGQIVGNMFGAPQKSQKMTVKKAREILLNEECDKLIDKDNLNAEAISRAEEEGIIFIDEIDKIANRNEAHSNDVSREGVQRDILPIVEGSAVNTKYGVVHTDHILFIAAGAFHVSNIEDLIPELQGRFPVRVELDSLTKQDFEKILTLTENAITKQYQQLLAVDNVELEFTDEAIGEIADLAEKENQSQENIGARRLQTLMEQLLEDISYHADGKMDKAIVVIDQNYVEAHLNKTLSKYDIKRYIL
ncbi:MAG: ATP-dependent protease ATPase subunit HslU [Clostridia bacterium]|nr:ATP-dependent protease ATPase subunit HslU [Clostridia bacterium]